ncbi:MAG TPA: hypothetical protein VJC11_02070, partial [Patescibacteria group bacterium]|nr:hypothetical protein [Patescibacteria group bacterium]
PYYATSRVILVLAGDPKLRPMVNRAVRWIFQTQHANGLWGFNDGTVEETVYALMGLLHFNESVKVIPHDILARGTVALSQTRRGDIPFPAWITKVLYAPSSIISMSRNCLLLHES